MKLKVWRDDNSKTQQWVAGELTRMALAEGDPEGISQSSVDRWEKGTIPRKANVRRLAKLTGGLVTFADFYGAEPEPPKRKPRDRAVSVAASRKAAVSRRSMREVRQ